MSSLSWRYCFTETIPVYFAFLIWPLKHFKVAQCHLFWRAVTFSLYIFNSYIYNVYFFSNHISLACGVYSVYFIVTGYHYFYLFQNWMHVLITKVFKQRLSTISYQNGKPYCEAILQGYQSHKLDTM